MDFLITQLLNGLVYAMLLFLTAAGLSLIFGLMNVVSLVHGSFFMLGAFLGIAIFQETHSFWLALLLAPLPAAGLGCLLEMLFLRRLYKRGHGDQVLLTFGFTFIFYDVVRSIWGTEIRSMPAPAILQGTVTIAGAPFPEYRLFLIGLGFALALVLWLFLERSRLGAMVRAGVDDAAMASGLGINVRLLFTAVFGAGVGLAALGGVAAGPVLGAYAGLDVDILIPAFIVIVVGGMGTLRGAFVGSLLIGEANVFGQAYLPDAAMFLIYLVMAVVLLVRPRGFFGIKQMPPAAAVAALPSGNAAEAFGRQALAFRLLALAAMAGLPLLVGSYSLTVVGEVYIFAIFAMSLDLLLGFTGLMSLGHAAFFGIGAYAVVILNGTFELDAWLGMACGVAIAGAAAAAIGFFCVRTIGVTFLMLTMAFSQLVYSIALKWRDVTGGSDGLSMAARPRFLLWSLDNPMVMYYMTLAFFVAAFLALRRLRWSPLGHVFVGIRENEQRMLAIGYGTRLYKLASFTIGGTIAGLAGGLYAIFDGFVSPDALYWSASGNAIIMTILGGKATLIGPALGAGIFLILKNLVSSYSEHWMLVIGIAFVSCVMFFPAGIWGTLWQLWTERQARHAGKRAA